MFSVFVLLCNFNKKGAVVYTYRALRTKVINRHTKGQDS